ncbi:hypothetical protein ACDQ55_14515 [Chitinophaga sp. 30R24]|uniref:hypothetical protein n=1 Tax=Chitinophaga sp. 30R24 TaxID=3248838 RepID=UPI003B8F88DC
MRKILIWFVCLLAAGRIQAQHTASLQKAVAILEEAGHHFTSGSQSLNMHYTIADADQPDVLLDSMKCSMQTLGNNFRMETGNMLTIKNDRYTIVVFHEDKLIYLTGASPRDSSAPNPAGMLIQALQSAGMAQSDIREEGDTVTLHFRFGENSAYRDMLIKLNKDHSRLYSSQYLIDGEQLPFEFKDLTKGTYALLQVIFSYRPAVGLTAADFDERQFFTRKDNVLVPTGAYKNYEVITGTPSN